jgi:hypothetical protein
MASWRKIKRASVWSWRREAAGGVRNDLSEAASQSDDTKLKTKAERDCVFYSVRDERALSHSGTCGGRGGSALAFQTGCANCQIETGRKFGFSHSWLESAKAGSMMPLNPIMGQAYACIAKAPLK